MLYKQTTQVPNFFFDRYLSTFTEAEVKVFLVILRQTFGWIDRRTGKRKERDRITSKWFIRATGLSKRAISKALCSLSFKRLILISDYQGNELFEGEKRKGKSYLYYSIKQPEHILLLTKAQKAPEPKHKTSYNKTNTYQTKRLKLSAHTFEHVGKFL